MTDKPFRTKLAAFAIPFAFVAAALGTRALLAHPPAKVAIDLAQPLPVVTNWYGYGAIALAILGIAVALAAVAYLKSVHAAARGETGIAFVLVSASLALAAAWLMPVLYSSDVYAYALYGELARLGSDPYAHAILGRGNPVFDAAIFQWGNPPPTCVYGPAFVAIADAIVTALRELGVAAQLNALRLLACVAFLGCTALTYVAFPGTVSQRTAAAATVGLNPVAIWCAAEGHNDAIALAIAIAGFALVRSGWFATGGTVAALSAVIKAPGIAAGAVIAFVSSRARLGALAGIAVAIVLSLPLLRAVTLHVAPGGAYAPHASLQAVFGAIPWLAFTVAGLTSLAFAYSGIATLRRGEPQGWCLLALAAWVLIPNPYPWYGLWLLPLAALAPRTRGAIVAVLFSLTSMLRYIPDAVGAPNELEAVFLGIVASLPYAAIIKRPS